MAYEFKYRLNSAPEARSDGSGMIDHDIYAIASVDGGDFAVIPGRHKTISVPNATIQAALAQSTTGAKVTAYKSALAANLGTQPEPVIGWDVASLTAVMDANIAAAAAASAADALIDGIANYPVDFAY